MNVFLNKNDLERMFIVSLRSDVYHVFLKVILVNCCDPEISNWIIIEIDQASSSVSKREIY